MTLAHFKHQLDQTVLIRITTTLKTAEEMDQADDELRETIRHIWPLQAKKMLDLLIPRSDCLNQGKLTVGKLYAGLLILESWRTTRFGQIDSGLPVRVDHSCNLYTDTPLAIKYLVSFGVVNRHVWTVLSKSLQLIPQSAVTFN